MRSVMDDRGMDSQLVKDSPAQASGGFVPSSHSPDMESEDKGSGGSARKSSPSDMDCDDNGVDIPQGQEENNRVQNYRLDPATGKLPNEMDQDIQRCITDGTDTYYSLNSAVSHFPKLEPELGGKPSSGAFGVVYKFKDITGKNLTQKWLKKDAKLERNEMEVPLRFPGVENIVKCYGLVVYCRQFILIMEDAGISLHQLIKYPHCPMLDIQLHIEKIMLDVMTALSILAKYGIIHGDIHLGNICLDMITWTAKLVDFGSSKTPDDDTTDDGSTPDYLDPTANKCLCETGKKPKMDKKDDVYSAGLAGFKLVTKNHPIIELFDSINIKKTMSTTEKQNCLRKWISEMNQATMTELIRSTPMSDTMKELLDNILKIDRDERWTAEKARRFLQEKLPPASRFPIQEQQPHHLQQEFTPE